MAKNEKTEYILAIDPGNIESAYCVIDKNTYKPIEFDKIENEKLLEYIYDYLPNEVNTLVIEKIASYGMAVGASVFDTCIWIGRFVQEYLDFTSPYYQKVEYIYRKEEKINLCNSMKAKDSNIRQALIDRFGIVGTKKEPGWFYGFKKDIWAAYAVGITYLDKIKRT